MKGKEMETVTKMLEREIEKIKEEMCDNYCKKPYEYSMAAGIEATNTSEMPDGLCMNFMDEVCDKCPLGRL